MRKNSKKISEKVKNRHNVSKATEKFQKNGGKMLKSFVKMRINSEKFQNMHNICRNFQKKSKKCRKSEKTLKNPKQLSQLGRSGNIGNSPSKVFEK